MAEKAGRKLKLILGDWRDLVEKGGSRKIMRALGEEAVKIIVRRTRLGKTSRRTRRVNTLGEIKNSVLTLKQMKPHSAAYRRFRRDNRQKLDTFTRWNRQNLTLGGDLLASIGVRRVENKSVTIGADAKRHQDLDGETGRLTNVKLAEYVTAQGRPFLELSTLDDKKLTRFYRRQFSDLRKRFGKPI